MNTKLTGKAGKILAVIGIGDIIEPHVPIVPVAGRHAVGQPLSPRRAGKVNRIGIQLPQPFRDLLLEQLLSVHRPLQSDFLTQHTGLHISDPQRNAGMTGQAAYGLGHLVPDIFHEFRINSRIFAAGKHEILPDQDTLPVAEIIEYILLVNAAAPNAQCIHVGLLRPAQQGQILRFVHGSRTVGGWHPIGSPCKNSPAVQHHHEPGFPRLRVTLFHVNGADTYPALTAIQHAPLRIQQFRPQHIAVRLPLIVSPPQTRPFHRHAAVSAFRFAAGTGVTPVIFQGKPHPGFSRSKQPILGAHMKHRPVFLRFYANGLRLQAVQHAVPYSLHGRGSPHPNGADPGRPVPSHLISGLSGIGTLRGVVDPESLRKRFPGAAPAKGPEDDVQPVLPLRYEGFCIQPVFYQHVFTVSAQAAVHIDVRVSIQSLEQKLQRRGRQLLSSERKTGLINPHLPLHPERLHIIGTHGRVKDNAVAHQFGVDIPRYRGIPPNRFQPAGQQLFYGKSIRIKAAELPTLL